MAQVSSAARTSSNQAEMCAWTAGSRTTGPGRRGLTGRRSPVPPRYTWTLQSRTRNLNRVHIRSILTGNFDSVWNHLSVYSLATLYKCFYIFNFVTSTYSNKKALRLHSEHNQFNNSKRVYIIKLMWSDKERTCRLSGRKPVVGYRCKRLHHASIFMDIGT